MADAEDRILQARSKLFQNVFNLTEKKKLHDTLISSVKMNLNLQKHIRESHVTKADEWNKSKRVLLDSIKWSEHSGNDRKWDKLINDYISQIATRRKILNQALARERDRREIRDIVQQLISTKLKPKPKKHENKSSR